MSDTFDQLTFSAKSFLVILYESDVGYRAPILAYSDKALAWAHFLDIASKYPGDSSKLHLYIIGEFDPFSDKPVTLYDKYIEITSDAAAPSDLFDHYLIESVNRYLTHNDKSVYCIALKDPDDPATVLSDVLRERLKGDNSHDTV